MYIYWHEQLNKECNKLFHSLNKLHLPLSLSLSLTYVYVFSHLIW